MDAGATQVGIFSKQVWVLSGERHQPDRVAAGQSRELMLDRGHLTGVDDAATRHTNPPCGQCPQSPRLGRLRCGAVG